MQCYWGFIGWNNNFLMMAGKSVMTAGSVKTKGTRHNFPIDISPTINFYLVKRFLLNLRLIEEGSTYPKSTTSTSQNLKNAISCIEEQFFKLLISGYGWGMGYLSWPDSFFFRHFVFLNGTNKGQDFLFQIPTQTISGKNHKCNYLPSAFHLLHTDTHAQALTPQ